MRRCLLHDSTVAFNTLEANPAPDKPHQVDAANSAVARGPRANNAACIVPEVPPPPERVEDFDDGIWPTTDIDKHTTSSPCNGIKLNRTLARDADTHHGVRRHRVAVGWVADRRDLEMLWQQTNRSYLNCSIIII